MTALLSYIPYPENSAPSRSKNAILPEVVAHVFFNSAIITERSVHQMEERRL